MGRLDEKGITQKYEMLRRDVSWQLDQTLALLRQAKQSALAGENRGDVLDRISQARGKLRQVRSWTVQMQVLEELYKFQKES